MEKEVNSLKERIRNVSQLFLERAKNKEILVISHFDTDGITSAAIMIKCLKKLDAKFSVKIVKSLEEQFFRDLPSEKLVIFLDLASGSLNYISESKPEEIFIIDHHEIPEVKIPEKVTMINPHLHNDFQKISSSCLTYLFCKEINSENKDAAKLGILGMIGDMLENEIDKLNNGILEDGEIKRKRGLVIYPSTRPLNRTLEFSSNPYIPKVTGDSEGVTELLREIGLTPENGKYKSLIELEDEEMEKLVTAIMLRNPRAKNKEIIGDIFLIKLYNKLEDARELSAQINACSRYGESSVALRLCLEIPSAKKTAETIHAKYRQHLLSGLKFASSAEKIEGKKFVIINARNYIKDTMIGTIVSIISNSSMYDDGTVIIGLAYYEDKIKVSARIVGRDNNSRNAREILSPIIEKIGGEVGGHKNAAGCVIHISKEKDFLTALRKNLEIEMVKI